MSLRTRLLIAFAAVVLIPIALLAFGLRQDMTRRLSQEYQHRVQTVVDVIREDLARESAAIAERLASLESALQNDNRFRLATVAGVESEREYLLDYAGTAMRLSGLSMLQIQDADGRILSSGHFRNEHGRIESGLAPALDSARGVALVTTRGAEREFLALARAESFIISGRTFTIVGGLAVDEAFLARLARDRASAVSLRYPGGELSTAPLKPDARDDAVVAALQVPVIRASRTARGSAERSRAGTPGSDAASDAAQDPAAQRGFMVSHDRRGDRALPRSCWRCWCRRASAGGWRPSPTRRPCSISIASTSSSIPARTKSADSPGCSAISPRDCAPARPACARPSGAPPSASWRGRSITTSRTA